MICSAIVPLLTAPPVPDGLVMEKLPFAWQTAIDYATALTNTIRDPRLRRRFAERPIVTGLFERTPVPIPSSDSGSDADADAAPLSDPDDIPLDALPSGDGE